MKKILTILLAVCFCITFHGCANTPENPQDPPATTEQKQTTGSKDPQIDIKDFPFVGLWKQTEADTYWRVQEDGTLTQEFVLQSTSTITVNGVSSTTTSKRIQTMPGTWSLQNEKFMFENKSPFNPVVDGEDCFLKNDTVTYIRIGDVDTKISLESSDSKEAAEATTYSLGKTLTAEGIELTLPEGGIADDIRVTSKSSGIKITSGPSPNPDKQFVFLKGTLKYTGKTSVFPAIGGKVILDGYEYKVSVSLINEDGTPCSTIAPLDSVIILIYAHVPSELTQSFKTGEITFGFNDNFENVDITNCDYLYKVDANALKG